ncbi:MAG: CARDB domain-containing protein, partial [Bacteroidota bacterium]
RFRVSTGAGTAEGWIIDDFFVGEEVYNVFTRNEDPVYISDRCDSVQIQTLLGFEHPYLAADTLTSTYYLSLDSLLDPTDSLLISPVVIVNGDDTTLTPNIPVPADIIAGQTYYLLWQHDASNQIAEPNETDNSGHLVLIVDSARSLPHKDDFEGLSAWRSGRSHVDQPVVWTLGEGFTHHLEGTHSGEQAWHTGIASTLNDSVFYSVLSEQYLYSPYFDLSTSLDPLVLSFWYKGLTDPTQEIQLQVSQDCGENWISFSTLSPPRGDEWDSFIFEFGIANVAPNAQFRIQYLNSPAFPEGLIIDDVYLGPTGSDLSIERTSFRRSLNAGQVEDTLSYLFMNSGTQNTVGSKTAFYWSVDSTLDASDLFIGFQTEPGMGDTSQVWRDLSFFKPTQVPGDYYILYVVDSTATVVEWREENNHGVIPVHVAPRAHFPYSNDFESQADGWRSQASLGTDVWEWGTPTGNHLDAAFSGQKAWVTDTAGALPGMSRMHLLSPVFDLTQAQDPVLHFRASLDYDPACACEEGLSNLSYSLDGGARWTMVDTVDQSFNRLYYPVGYGAGDDRLAPDPRISSLFFDLSEPAFLASSEYNGRDAQSTSYFNVHMPQLAGEPNVQFRFNVVSQYNPELDSASQREGLLIDDVVLEEGQTDLEVAEMKSLLLSKVSPEIGVELRIRNHGNLAPMPSSLDFYLSEDSVLDPSDQWIGRDSLAPFRPDYLGYL